MAPNPRYLWAASIVKPPVQLSVFLLTVSLSACEIGTIKIGAIQSDRRFFDVPQLLRFQRLSARSLQRSSVTQMASPGLITRAGWRRIGRVVGSE